MNYLRRLVAGCFFAALSIGAQASPTYTPIGDFSIQGKNYAVTLLSDTTYNSQSFSALLPTITFTNAEDASAAVSVLLATLGSSFDWNPSCLSCGNGFRVVYAFDDTTYSYYTGYYNGGPFGSFSQSLGGGNSFSFAQFNANANRVPEPDTVTLIGIALAGLATRLRKQKNLNS